MRAAIYTRVSTEMQASEGFSLEAQQDKLLDYIKLNSMELHRIYTDPGVSAKDLDRPGVQEMITDLKRGLFGAVIVHKLDRLTRNISDLYDLVEMVTKHNVKLISLSENIDTSTAMGRMFVYLLGIFAQMFLENLRDEVRKGMSKRAEKGFHNVTVPLFGYDLNEGVLTINEKEAKLVQWIFDQYLEGVGASNIAKKINELGIRRNRGSFWDHHKVMLMLKNVHYTGRIHWKAANLPESERIIRDGQHDSIISDETFEKVQRIIERRNAGTMSKTSYDYVYGGIITCGLCNQPYHGKYNIRPSQVLYRGYVCSSHAKYGTCDASGISERNLTKLVMSYGTMGADTLLQSYSEVAVTSQINEYDELQQQLNLSESRRERWQLAYADGNMPYTDFSKRMQEEMSKVSEMEKRVQELPRVVPSTVSPEKALEALKLLKENWDYIEQNTRKQIIQSLFQKITIMKMGKKWEITEIKLA